jgi:photosystem II stability/assembly factor-like uncharacterized protein
MDRKYSARRFGFAAVIAATLLIAAQPLSAARTSLSTLAGQTHFHGIAVAAGEPSRLYLATHHGLYAVAADGGADRISSDGNDYMGFTPHPGDPDILHGSGHLAGGGNMGFISSRDGGKTWRKLSDGIGGPVDFHQMDVSKADPLVIVGMSRGLQISRNGGRSWEMIGPGPAGLIDLAASAKDGNTFYAATRRGLVRSTDGGRTWKPAHLVRRPTTMVHVTAEGVVYAYQIGTGLMKTAEPGLNWRIVNSNFGQSYMVHLAADPTNPKLLYAITTNQQRRTQLVIFSRDGGRSWKALGGN